MSRQRFLSHDLSLLELTTGPEVSSPTVQQPRTLFGSHLEPLSMLDPSQHVWQKALAMIPSANLVVVDWEAGIERMNCGGGPGPLGLRSQGSANDRLQKLVHREPISGDANQIIAAQSSNRVGERHRITRSARQRLGELGMMSDEQRHGQVIWGQEGGQHQQLNSGRVSDLQRPQG
jgi:hypothetical protein